MLGKVGKGLSGLKTFNNVNWIETVTWHSVLALFLDVLYVCRVKNIFLLHRSDKNFHGLFLRNKKSF